MSMSGIGSKVSLLETQLRETERENRTLKARIVGSLQEGKETLSVQTQTEEEEGEEEEEEKKAETKLGKYQVLERHQNLITVDGDMVYLHGSNGGTIIFGPEITHVQRFKILFVEGNDQINIGVTQRRIKVIQEGDFLGKYGDQWTFYLNDGQKYHNNKKDDTYG